MNYIYIYIYINNNETSNILDMLFYQVSHVNLKSRGSRTKSLVVKESEESEEFFHMWCFVFYEVLLEETIELLKP